MEAINFEYFICFLTFSLEVSHWFIFYWKAVKRNLIETSVCALSLFM